MYTPGTSLLCFVIQGAFETDGNLCVTSFENVLSNWTRLQGGTAANHLYQAPLPSQTVFAWPSGTVLLVTP